MSHPLSTHDLTRITRALQTLLAPLGETESVGAWRAAVHDALCDLMGAGGANVLLPAGDDVAWHTPELTVDAAASYHAHFAAQDLVCNRVLARGLRVAHEWMVTTPRELRASAFYHEWVRPNWPLDEMFMLRADVGAPAPAVVTLSCAPAGRAALGAHDREHRLQLLGAVWPAFEAGARAAFRHAGRRAALARVLDRLAEPLAVYDADGRAPLHVNAALERLLAAAPAHAPVVRAGVERAVRDAAALRRAGGAPTPEGAGVRELRVLGATYRVRVTRAAPGVIGADESLLASVERHVPDPLADATLRARFGLTPRQCEVARLLAAGADNETIAARLGVTAHTGRRHTEQVLAKLGVRSRAKVGVVLRGPALDAPDAQRAG
jgi:DNA-binding CsgD family transcriptional regulator